MTTDEDIDRILSKIGEIWKKHPELRLLQLLLNCFKFNTDYYYVEDKKLEKGLSIYTKNKDFKNKYWRSRG